MTFETRLLTLNISRAKRHLSLWSDFSASPEVAEGTIDGWIGWRFSKVQKSLAKKSASQRVTTNHPNTENHQVNSANL